jgi:hypothetical protein
MNPQPIQPNTLSKKKMKVSDLIKHIPNKKIAAQFFQSIGNYKLYNMYR